MSRIFDMKSFFNFLRRNKSYTAINIFGLSVSLVFVIIISSYALSEIATDNFQEKKNRIYVVTFNEYMLASPKFFTMLEEFPEIESACTINNMEFEDMTITDKTNTDPKKFFNEVKQIDYQITDGKEMSGYVLSDIIHEKKAKGEP